MRRTLNKKLGFGFLIAIIVSIIIVNIVSKIMIDKEFNQYLYEEHKSKVNKIIGLVEESELKEGTDKIARYAALENYYIEVRDKENKLIFTSGKDNLIGNNMMNSMMGHMNGDMMKNMMSGNHNMHIGDYIEEKYKLNINNEDSGTIIIGYFGNWNVSNEAMNFKLTLNKSLLISGIVALVLGLFISLIISKSLTIPLIKMSKAANEMTKGNLETRVAIKTDTIEIDNLSQSINYLAETLQKQDMLRKRLSSDIAHEIRTPLTTLKTYIEAIMDGVWEPTKEKLESCHEEIERITKLTEGIQNLSKIDEENIIINKTKFNVSLEIEKVLNTFEATYRKKSLKTIIELDSNVVANLDRDKFKQIMFNILSNSYKYSKAYGDVSIRLKKDKDWIKIEVEDTGIGIAKDDLPYIFERFYRGDLSRARETGGSGIGLTITKSFVEAHGGKIEVESIKEKGSIFRIALPI
ncbi:HAMP domain-containing sensor histidine kinase [Clostridium sp.]|uniref:HAMP domain-containing sensor histidine kinase n=1 Tax=Clostridium sp. TaxID=1506 RepID=UPI0026261380|nr:HAMP domain-containing sensor histidine kinase [Clostridium sp.]